MFIFLLIIVFSLWSFMTVEEKVSMRDETCFIKVFNTSVFSVFLCYCLRNFSFYDSFFMLLFRQCNLLFFYLIFFIQLFCRIYVIIISGLWKWNVRPWWSGNPGRAAGITGVITSLSCRVGFVWVQCNQWVIIIFRA